MKLSSRRPELTRAAVAVACILACIAAPVLGAFEAQGVAAGSPPTISDTTDKVVQKNGTLGPIAFTIGDADDLSGNSLTMSAGSSDTTLVPIGNIVFGGSGNSRNVTITPSANLIGTAVITLTVTDADSNTASDTFNLKVNAPPHFDANTGLTLNQGTTGTFTTAILNSTDPDNSPSQITYTIPTGGGGGPPVFGTLKVNGTAIGAGGTFTQADVDNNLLTYTHDGTNNFSDQFQVGITDSDGGVSNDSGFTTFTVHINITPVNRPPVAINGSTTMPSNVVFSGTFQASDADNPEANQTLTRRIITNGTKGTAVLDNATTGAFHYTPNPGASGQDTIVFQVNDGSVDATNPGTFTINIANNPPVAVNGSGSTGLSTLFNGTFDATDADTPPQTLTRRIITNGAKGTAVLDNATTGAFHYTPNSGQSGQDTIIFQVNDGLADANTAGSFTITIVNQPPTAQNGSGTTSQGVPLNGTLTATDVDQPPQQLTFAIGTGPTKGSVNITDIHSGAFTYTPNPGSIGSDSFTFTASDGIDTSSPATFSVFIRPNFVAGYLFITNTEQTQNGQVGSVIEINPDNGMQAVVASGGNLNNPQAIAVDHNQKVVVAETGNNNNRLIRIDPATGVQTVIPTGPTYQSLIGLAIGPGPDIFVSDPFGGALYELDPTSGAIVHQCTGLNAPAGLAFDTNGVLIVGFVGAFANVPTRISAYDMGTCAETPIASGGNLLFPVSLAVDSNNDIVVGEAPAIAGAPAPNRLLRITRSNGFQAVVSSSVGVPTGVAVKRSSNDYFSADESGVTVYKTTSAGTSTVASAADNIVKPFGVAIVPRTSTAAGVSVSGRVLTSVGAPVSNAVIRLESMNGAPSRAVRSNAFGYYRFDDVQSGAAYVLAASARSSSFAPRVIVVRDQIADEDIVAAP